jgi:hypothetical protein
MRNLIIIVIFLVLYFLGMDYASDDHLSPNKQDKYHEQ